MLTYILYYSKILAWFFPAKSLSLKRIALLAFTSRKNLFYLILFCMVLFGRYLSTLPISDIYFLNVNKIRRRQQIN